MSLANQPIFRCNQDVRARTTGCKRGFTQNYTDTLQGTASETDKEENDHRDVPGAWRQGKVLTDLSVAEQGNNVTLAAKRETFLETLL